MLFLIILFLIIIFFNLFLHIYFYLKEINIFYRKYNNFLNNDTKLNEIKLLGTHNSLSYKIKNILSPFAKTQNYDLNIQLNKNIRYFDLRFKIENNELQAYHNFIKLNINHKEVFNIFISFLKKNPDTFLIIVLKDENFNNHENIAKFLYEYIQENKLEEFFYFNTFDWNYIPNIKDLKKKIYLLNFIKKNNSFYSLPWGDNKTFTNGLITISDCYKSSNYDKINIYKEFDKNLIKNNINIFYFSSQYKPLFGLYYYNKNFTKRLIYNFNKNIFKDKIGIYVFDFFELYYNFF